MPIQLTRDTGCERLELPRRNFNREIGRPSGMRSEGQHRYPGAIESAGRRSNTTAVEFKRVSRRPRRLAGTNHPTSEVQLMITDSSIGRDGLNAIASDDSTVGQTEAFQPVRERLASPRKWRLK